MAIHLFTYGTLMVPEIMTAVSGAEFEGRPAILRDHARYCLQGETYPGLIEEPGASVDGVAYLHLTPEALQRLDRFEGEWYERKTVRLDAPLDGDAEAQTYLLHPIAHSHIVRKPWTLDDFKRDGIRCFLSDYQGFGQI